MRRRPALPDCTARPIGWTPNHRGQPPGGATLPCVLPKGVPQDLTESEGQCYPQEALYLPTFSHLLIVDKRL
jgi:hypothetical protein